MHPQGQRRWVASFPAHDSKSSPGCKGREEIVQRSSNRSLLQFNTTGSVSCVNLIGSFLFECFQYIDRFRYIVLREMADKPWKTFGIRIYSIAKESFEEGLIHR
ncbi:uncharacterized protein LOC112552466 [Pogonomyrmex barbatus]|uniref:Uncharacterized protein LOC112552466 n=1 Tax=Pogonomyrmex barbatus TaxID=144034 RepID=A0A8N1S601_9HYME|nr:uncharacterized protein LOC112552466 [Pogonomyrmex barbatus]